MNATASSAITEPELSSILNPDGTVRKGHAGSFDAKGLRMAYGQNTEPRFLPESGAPEGATNCNDGWDDRFFTNGVSGGHNQYDDAYVYAAAADGSGNLYVGGNFIYAGSTLANNIAKWDGDRWSALVRDLRS
jgi:hypothetical protein